jgi:hypothetical protein
MWVYTNGVYPMDVQAGTAGIRDEVARLRRQLRVTQWAAAAAVLVVGSLFAARGRDRGSPGASGTVPDAVAVAASISARELILRDDKGNARATLRCSGAGQPVLTLVGTGGARIDLGFLDRSDDAPELTIADAKGQSRLSLFSRIGQPDGETGFNLIDDAGNARFLLGYSRASGSHLSLKPAKLGDATATLWMTPVGNPGIQFIDGTGKYVLDVQYPYKSR